jgi:hypothetical protein
MLARELSELHIWETPRAPDVRRSLPTFGSDRPAFRNDRPAFRNDRPTFGSDFPTFGDDCRTSDNDRPVLRIVHAEHVSTWARDAPIWLFDAYLLDF